ncbi:MAG: zinc ribbon domain-containing protein [Nocardiaceae bacterium]|nr:zinc ribbon domain-containing protein [Nocardiaceae bacterium]
MPRYDYRCRSCGMQFEVDRPMAQASEPAICPEGHSNTVKLISMFAVGGGASASSLPVQAPPTAGGGCCGGGGCC